MILRFDAVMAEACLRAAEALRGNLSPMDACTAATVALEVLIFVFHYPMVHEKAISCKLMIIPGCKIGDRMKDVTCLQDVRRFKP